MRTSRIVGARLQRNLSIGVFLTLGALLLQRSTPLNAASNLTTVVDAAKADDLSAVTRLIKARADVNTPSSDGSSALLWAAFHSDADMAKSLLAAGASVDAASRYGVTPLLQASRNGNAEMMKILLDAGAQPSRWHPEGETPLMAASRTGNADAVRLLLAKGSLVNAADPFQEQTALMWAAAEGHAEIVKLLLAAGADANLQAHVSQLTERRNADHPSGGFTALMFAARNGHRAAVEALMKGGANSKLTNADSLTATSIAIINDRLDLAKEMLDLGADPNDGALYFAVEMHDATTDTRAQDATRMQPDHENTMTALGLVKALLDLKADPNKAVDGAIHSTSMCCGPTIHSSPIYRAALAGDVEVLKLLLAKGAQPDWSPAEVKEVDGKKPAAGVNANVGRTPAMLAMKGGGGPALQAGPGYSRSGPPPFREAGSRDPIEAVKLLIAAGANASAKGPDGNTLLHLAVQAQQLETIKALAAAGAKLDEQNKDKLTALAVAEAMGAGRGGGPAGGANALTGAPTAPGRGTPRATRDDMVKLLRELMHLPAEEPKPASLPAAAKETTEPQ